MKFVSEKAQLVPGANSGFWLVPSSINCMGWNCWNGSLWYSSTKLLVVT